MNSFLDRYVPKWRGVLAVVLILLSCLVMFFPSMFYTTVEIEKIKTEEAGQVSLPDDKVVQAELMKLLSDVRDGIAATASKIETARSELNRYSTRRDHFENVHAISIEIESRKLRELLIQQEHIKTDLRAVSPIFSQVTFDEARELYWDRQGVAKDVSKQMWMWDMIFSSFDGRSGDNLSEVLVYAILRLIWRLTFGALFAFIDFAIRLPFYLKEYDIYTPASTSVASTSDRTASESTADEASATADTNQKEGVNVPSHLGDDGSGSVWINNRKFTPNRSKTSTVKAFAFYMLALLGAGGGTVLMILVFWSPIFLFALAAYFKQPSNTHNNYGGTHSQYRGEAYTGHPHHL